MNKIVLDNQNELIDIDNTIFLEKDDNLKYQIIIKENTDLLLNLNNINNISFEFTLNDNNLNLYIIKKGTFANVKEHYIVNKGNLNINKFNDVSLINENIIIDLNNELSNIFYNFKTITKNQETYEIILNHNNKYTNANIINNGINIENGTLDFKVSSYIKKGNIKCVSNQNNRIINETNNKCSILPNLYIDENDVIASHSAHIGTFNEDEIFYLNSRGIPLNEAKKLLIRGYLLSNMDETIKNEALDIINNYWR